MIKEIAIALFDSPGGVEEGDVIICRKPLDWIGKKEASMWLWIKADLPENIAKVLAAPLLDGDNKIVQKRRFKIELAKIKEIQSEFDEVKARDLVEEYQPYMPVDGGYNFNLAEVTPLDLTGIILDKSIGEYI